MAAEELNKEKLEDLKGQIESLGLHEKQRNKLITEEWRRMKEAKERRIAAEEQRIAAEGDAEGRRLAAQAEEQRIAAEEQRIAAESEAEERNLDSLMSIHAFLSCNGFLKLRNSQ